LVLALTTDVHDTLWIATKDGICSWDGRRFASVPVPPKLKFEEVTTIVADLEGGLWFGTREPGIYHWSHHVLTLIDVGPALIGTAGTVDRSGRVWIGFEDGSIAVHFHNRIQRYGRSEGLPAALIRAVYEDASGTIWVGSSAGISWLQNGRFVTMTSVTADVPLRDLTAVLVDRDDYLWLATSAGVVRLRRSDAVSVKPDGAFWGTFVRWDSSDGIPGNTVVPKHPAATVAADGKLWFIASHGVAIIDTKAVSTEATPLPLRIEGGIADRRAFDAVPGFSLPPRTSTLEINYLVTALSAPSKIRFRYKLEGFDEAWIDAGARRQAFYTNLPPRQYEFRVMAYDGLSTATKAWSFSIAPAFYQTQWFRVSSGLALAAAIGGLVWVWTFQVRKRFAVVLDERARIAREIHDTALQGMASVAMKLESVVKKIDALPSGARDDIRRLRRQIEQQIDETRRSVLNLRSSTVEPRTLPVTLREFAEHLGSDLRCQVELTVSGQPEPCGGDIDHELLRIAQEAVRNSVQHGKARHVRIDVGYQHNSISLCVADDGCGFNPEGRGKDAISDHQWGLKGMRERAKRIGGRFSLVSAPGTGTRIETVVQRRTMDA
jgi:signal transduction histidine kinase